MTVFLTLWNLVVYNWSLGCSLSDVPGLSDHYQLPGAGSTDWPEQKTQKFIKKLIVMIWPDWKKSLSNRPVSNVPRTSQPTYATSLILT